MSKLSLNELTLPLFSLQGRPYRQGEEKYLWISAKGPDQLPKVTGFRVVQTGRTFDVKASQWSDGQGSFQIKGIPEAALTADLTLIPETWPLHLGTKALFIPLGPGNQKLKGPSGTLKSEVLESRGRGISFKRIEATGGKFLVLATARRGFPVLVGAKYTLEDEEGRVVPLALLSADPLRDRDVDELVHKAYRFPGEPTVAALYSLNLRLRGWVELPPPLWSEEFTDSLGVGGVRIMKLARENLAKKLLRLIRRPGGMSRSDLTKAMELPEAVLGQLLGWLEEEKKLVCREGHYLPQEEAENYLSPLARKLWKDLEDTGLEGVHIPGVKSEVAQEQYRALIRMNLAVGLEEDWCLSFKAYAQARKKVCRPEWVGKTMTLSDLKEVLGPGRRMLLALLNRMEDEGYLVREEAVRRILKADEAV